VLGSVVATSSLPAYWLAADPARLPHYSHTAVVVGSVIIVSLIVLMAGVTFVLSKPEIAEEHCRKSQVLSAAEFDSFDHQQQRADNQVAA